MSTWPAETVPQYRAVSYTWGDMIFTNIVLNGCVLKVRRNCHDALVQCSGYDPDGYIWIDSLCINQDDVDEKSHQVAKMHAVYASARQVLACVGDHDHGSEFLVETCTTIRSRGSQQYFDEDETDDLLAELSEAWTGLTRDEVVARVQLSLGAFAQRSYWTRLWIVQEIVAGAENLLVLCGMSFMEWEELNMIEGMLDTLDKANEGFSESPLGQLVQLSSEILSSEGTIPLHDLMLQLDNAKCTDPRDRIYGLLALVDWEESGLEPIVPDYARSA